jgi:hypothetical protein
MVKAIKIDLGEVQVTCPGSMQYIPTGKQRHGQKKTKELKELPDVHEDGRSSALLMMFGCHIRHHNP